MVQGRWSKTTARPHRTDVGSEESAGIVLVLHVQQGVGHQDVHRAAGGRSAQVGVFKLMLGAAHVGVRVAA